MLKQDMMKGITSNRHRFVIAKKKKTAKGNCTNKIILIMAGKVKFTSTGSWLYVQKQNLQEIQLKVSQSSGILILFSQAFKITDFSSSDLSPFGHNSPISKNISLISDLLIIRIDSFTKSERKIRASLLIYWSINSL